MYNRISEQVQWIGSRTMSRLSQLGVFCTVLGGVVLFLGLFPSAVDADTTPGIGVTQVITVLAALSLILLGAYVVTYDLFRRGRPPTLVADVGVRLGLTGMVLAAASSMADVMGFGSHSGGGGPFFGWLQATGMLVGFGVAAVGVVLYGIARS